MCDSLDNLSKTYQSENTSTEAKAVALDHSTAALKNANNYLVEQLTAVEQRNQDMLREMQELRQELADMRASVQGYSPEKFAQSMAVAIKFLEEANGIYKHAQQPVSGGLMKEIGEDSRFFNVLLRGRPEQCDRYGEWRIAWGDHEDEIEKAWASVGVNVYLSRDGYNTYRISNGEAVT